MKKQTWRQVSQLLMLGSLAGVVLAGVGATGTDLWLASTQWLLVSIVLAILGIYSRLES